MRTETIQLFKFNELSDSAKEKACEQYRSQGIEYHWHHESLQSIQAFCEHFGVNLKRWSVCTYRGIDYSTDAENMHFRGMKLRDFDREHMPTGYFLDCDLWMTFYDEFKRTGDAKGAFDSALYAGFKAWRDDMEWQESDEYIGEHLEANEYEFTEDGEIY